MVETNEFFSKFSHNDQTPCIPIDSTVNSNKTESKGEIKTNLFQTKDAHRKRKGWDKCKTLSLLGFVLQLGHQCFYLF